MFNIAGFGGDHADAAVDQSRDTDPPVLFHGQTVEALITGRPGDEPSAVRRRPRLGSYFPRGYEVKGPQPCRWRLSDVKRSAIGREANAVRHLHGVRHRFDSAAISQAVEHAPSILVVGPDLAQI